MNALDERRAKATERHKANEMEFDEMLAEHTAVDAERRRLDEQKLKADIAAEQAEQLGDQRWRWECNRFMREVLRHEGIDYLKTASLNAALDAEVKTLANDDKSKDWTGRQFLEEAHNRVKAAMGLGKRAKTETDQDEAALQAAGGGDAANEGEFAEANALMEKGDSMALEAYIAGKSPDWQDRWARSGAA